MDLQGPPVPKSACEVYYSGNHYSNADALLLLLLRVIKSFLSNLPDSCPLLEFMEQWQPNLLAYGIISVAVPLLLAPTRTALDQT